MTALAKALGKFEDTVSQFAMKSTDGLNFECAVPNLILTAKNYTIY
jgi:hypothetical protein